MHHPKPGQIDQINIQHFLQLEQKYFFHLTAPSYLQHFAAISSASQTSNLATPEAPKKQQQQQQQQQEQNCLSILSNLPRRPTGS
uniref:Uncharacterized protein n=1 Tax=Candidozyma auris TaxID=498019 RepID=A0A0L0NWS4_CANAR